MRFRKDRKVCPLCGKRISKGAMTVHLDECMDGRWYSLPVVLVSHIDALSVKRIDGTVYGIWDGVAKDWVRDAYNVVDSRVFKGNADKLLRLVKVKAKFNALVGEKSGRG